MPKHLSDLRPYKLGVKRYSQVANAVANCHGVFFAMVWRSQFRIDPLSQTLHPSERRDTDRGIAIRRAPVQA